jgi:hypothetical protein
MLANDRLDGRSLVLGCQKVRPPEFSPGPSLVLGAFVAFACPLDMLIRRRKAAADRSSPITQ